MKQPIRQCMACREHKPKQELFRVTRSPEGTVSFDPEGKAQGRGAYLCKSVDCLKKARKNRGLERGLRKAVAPDIYDRLADIVSGENRG